MTRVVEAVLQPPSPSHRDLIPLSIPPVSRQVAAPAEWMPASGAGMMQQVGNAGEINARSEKCLDIRRMFLYCSCRLPLTEEVCTNRRCMGVKRFPSQLAAMTSSRERSGRAARRPWVETSSAPHGKPGRPEVPSVYLEGIWLHKTGSGESDGRPRQEAGCGAPFRCPLLLTASHLERRSALPVPSATAQGHRSQ